jgi:hypothetical protein
MWRVEGQLVSEADRRYSQNASTGEAVGMRIAIGPNIAAPISLSA